MSSSDEDNDAIHRRLKSNALKFKQHMEETGVVNDLMQLYHDTESETESFKSARESRQSSSSAAISDNPRQDRPVEEDSSDDSDDGDHDDVGHHEAPEGHEWEVFDTDEFVITLRKDKLESSNQFGL